MNAETKIEMDFDLSELEDIEATEIGLVSDEVKRLEDHHSAVQTSLSRIDTRMHWLRMKLDKLDTKRQRVANQEDKTKRLLKARKRFLFELENGDGR